MRCLKVAQPHLGPRIYEGAVTEGDWGSRCGGAQSKASAGCQAKCNTLLINSFGDR